MKLDKKTIASIVSLVAALATVLAVVLSGGGGKNGITITLGGPHGTPESTVTVPEHAVAQAKASDLDDHQDARSENPAGVTAKQLDAGQRQQEALAANDQLPIVTPDAAPQQRGCTTKLVQNYSSRRGVRPRVFVLHYTVSPNRPGWSDVYAVASLFDRASFQASSNYVIDNEGHCLYIVRESDKAWTQAAANPISISVEVINSGHEPTYAGTKGLDKIALVISDALKRWQIPVQQGAVSGCVVTRPGIVDHHSLGACGGGHFDITPYSVPAVIAAVQKARGAVPLPVKRVCTVRALQAALNARLLTHLTVDGVRGPATRAAVRKLQAKLGIPQTGNAGVKVGAALHLIGCRVS